MLKKQDRQGVRTPRALEQKYGFEKTKKTAEGAAQSALSAQKTAEEAKSAASGLDTKMDQTEIFNRLTNNGQVQGVLMDENGDIYINADYIVAINALFAKDITMTGKFESTVQAYLPPTFEDVAAISGALYNSESAYRTDLNGDGEFTLTDVVLAKGLYLGTVGYDACPGLEKSSVTLRINMSDTDKTIHIFGTNMWGSYVETCVGANPSKSSFAMKNYLDSMFKCDDGSESDKIYRTVNEGTTSAEREWLNPPLWTSGVLFRTYERFLGLPVYTMIVESLDEVPTGYTILRKSETISRGTGNYIQVWLIPEDSGD